MRILSAVLVSSICQGVFAAAPDEKDATHFVKHTFRPAAIGRAVASGGLAQVENEPHEWGQGMAGFARRFGSAFGFHFIKKSIEYPVAKLRHEQIGYRRSDKTGAKSRLIYALTAVVYTRKTTDGSKMLHTSEWSGAFGAGLLSRLWQPASTGSLAAGFSSAGSTLAIDAAMNVVQEFWPEIRHPRSHRVRAAEARNSKNSGAPDSSIPEDQDHLYVISEPDREDD